MKDSQTPSTRPPSSLPAPDRFYDTRCPACGTTYIAKSGGPCPRCLEHGRSGDEMTKKVLDEPDLIKGGW